MGMYDVFETDTDLETNGVWIDYGEFRVRIASAGSGNKNYMKYAEKKLKPVRKAMEAGALNEGRSQAIMADIFTKTVILDWETLVDKEWVQGIENREGEIVAFNEDNVLTALKDLPRLFLDLQEQAMSMTIFRKAELETDGKN